MKQGSGEIGGPAVEQDDRKEGRRDIRKERRRKSDKAAGWSVHEARPIDCLIIADVG